MDISGLLKCGHLLLRVMEHRSPIQNRSTDRFHAHTSPEYRHTESQRARHPATSTTSSIHSHEPFGLFAEKPPIHSTDNHDRHRHTLRIHPILFDTHLTLRRTPSVVASHRGHRCPVAVLPRRHGRHAGNSWRSPTVPTLVWRTRRFSGATGSRGRPPRLRPHLDVDPPIRHPPRRHYPSLVLF